MARRASLNRENRMGIRPLSIGAQRLIAIAVATAVHACATGADLGDNGGVLTSNDGGIDAPVSADDGSGGSGAGGSGTSGSSGSDNIGSGSSAGSASGSASGARTRRRNRPHGRQRH